MVLKLNDLEAECVIGERPDERTRTQRLLVNVALTVDDTAAETDQLEDAVDYARLVETIRATLAAARCQMIERAARVVAEHCLRQPRVKAVEVAVRKFGAVAHLESAEALCQLP